MPAKKRDYSALDKFNFERKPVGVKFVLARPKGMKKPDKALNMCEMIKYAQEGNAFYVGEEDLACVGIEQVILGMKDADPLLVSGAFGGAEGLFQGASSNRAMYQILPTMPKGSVRFAMFAPLDKMNFDPDVLIMVANINQAQTLLRTVNYSTGMPFESKMTPVVACAWMYIYPVVSGELNYIITGLGLGMQALNIYPPGLFIISVPFQRIPMMLENLKSMPYNATFAPGPGGDLHRKRVNKMMGEMRKKLDL
jgi:uncharacterized protein (DUF169 family)